MSIRVNLGRVQGDGVPAAGTAGQYLIKTGSGTGETAWASESACLYTGTLSAGDTVQLSEPAARFAALMICGGSGYAALMDPASGSFAGSCRRVGDATMRLWSANLTVSGTSLTCSGITEMALTASGNTLQTSPTAITRVWGLGRKGV